MAKTHDLLFMTSLESGVEANNSMYLLSMLYLCDPSVGRSKSTIRRLLNTERGNSLAILGCVPKL